MAKTQKISTHILTKRMTKTHWQAHFNSYISTHILTKRMTTFQYVRFLLECHFNSHPHEEDDDNQWNDIYTSNISTHILTKRMT